MSGRMGLSGMLSRDWQVFCRGPAARRAAGMADNSVPFRRARVLTAATKPFRTCRCFNVPLADIQTFTFAYLPS